MAQKTESKFTYGQDYIDYLLPEEKAELQFTPGMSKERKDEIATKKQALMNEILSLAREVSDEGRKICHELEAKPGEEAQKKADALIKQRNDLVEQRKKLPFYKFSEKASMQRKIDGLFQLAMTTISRAREDGKHYLQAAEFESERYNALYQELVAEARRIGVELKDAGYDWKK